MVLDERAAALDRIVLPVVSGAFAERLCEELGSLAGSWSPVGEAGVHNSEKSYFLAMFHLFADYDLAPVICASVTLRLDYCNKLYKGLQLICYLGLAKGTMSLTF